MQQLYYHKCDDCLTAFSTDVKKVDFCDCNGAVTFMGEVRGDKFVKLENKPACDGRCTHASGPMCDCQCGGANHGTGKMVATIVKEGKVCATNLTEEDVERAHVYRRFRDAAQQAYDSKYVGVMDMIKQGAWVERSMYMNCLNAHKAFDKANAMRQHAPRIKAFADFIMKQKS